MQIKDIANKFKAANVISDIEALKGPWFDKTLENADKNSEIIYIKGPKKNIFLVSPALAHEIGLRGNQPPGLPFIVLTENQVKSALGEHYPAIS